MGCGVVWTGKNPRCAALPLQKCVAHGPHGMGLLTSKTQSRKRQGVSLSYQSHPAKSGLKPLTMSMHVQMISSKAQDPDKLARYTSSSVVVYVATQIFSHQQSNNSSNNQRQKGHNVMKRDGLAFSIIPYPSMTWCKDKR